MGRILYIFPHPDDESFGPAPALARQQRMGHDVNLLTLTRGEATKQRHVLGYSKEEMADVRSREMSEVARTLNLANLTILDFPDGGLSEMNPLYIESAIEEHIRKIRPDVVVTYPLHGCSRHPDHVVGHTIVKRVFCALRAHGASYLKRLAFFTLPEKAEPGRPEHLQSSPDELIDCIIQFEEEDFRRASAALACYRTYQAVIEEHNPLAQVRPGVHFEIFLERHEPPLEDLFDALPLQT